MRPGRARALRQFTLSTGNSAGRNSSGRITVFHRGGGSKRLLRRIDLKRSTSSMGIYDASRGAAKKKNEHDRGVSSAAQDPRTYHEHHQWPLFVLFPAWEGGSKKGSLHLSWTDGPLM
ncbi:hypothetical protein YC2023_115184 [Brassica napus]